MSYIVLTPFIDRFDASRYHIGMQQSEYFIGLDPGQKGGIVILDAKGSIFESMPMPHIDIITDIAEWCFEQKEKVTVTLEDVQPDRGWHIKSAWSFAKHIGQLEYLFPNAVKVNPKTWQAALWLKGSKGSAKEKSLAAARLYWPHMTWLATTRSKVAHDGMADAALIARYSIGRLSETPEGVVTSLSNN